MKEQKERKYTKEEIKPKEITESQFMSKIYSLELYYAANPDKDPDKKLSEVVQNLKNNLTVAQRYGLNIRYFSSLLQGIYFETRSKGGLGFLAIKNERNKTPRN